MSSDKMGFDSLVKNQKKSTEVLTQTQKTATDFFMDFAHLNAQYWQSLFEDMQSNAHKAQEGLTNPAGSHIDYVKSSTQSSQKTWQHSQKIGDMIQKNTSKMADIYLKHVNDTMSDIKK